MGTSRPSPNRLALPLVALAWLASSSLVPATARAAGGPVVLRIASLAPEGSSWMKLFHQFQQAVEKRTERRVTFKFYSGGSMGDERDMLRKIRLGQLSGAAITATGLSAIDPEVRTVEAARTYQQLDALRAALAPLLVKRFADRGYVLLGWGDVGPVRFFSNRPVQTLADMQQTKAWMWNEDPVSKKLFPALGLNGVAMGVPDVLPALTTGSIDAFFGSPLSTLALQWSGHVKYVTSMVMSQATGAVVLSKKAWDAVSPEDQAIILDEGRKMEALVLSQVRGDNERALTAMKARGLQEIPTPAEMEQDLRAHGESVLRAIGETLSPETKAVIQRLLEEQQKKKD